MVKFKWWVDALSDISGTPFDIVMNGGHDPARFPVINNQTAINLFEFEGAMIPTAGFTRILTNLGGDTEGRGIFYSNVLSKCVAVIGDLLYSFTDEHYTLLGRLESLTGRVYFAENGLTDKPDNDQDIIGGQVALSDGKNVYIYSLDNTFVKATDDSGDPLPFTPGTLVYQNSFFFINDLTSDRIYASELNNAKIFPVLNFDVISEQTVSCLAFKNLLYVFGTDTTSIFYDNAQEFFPYSQDISRGWEYGCYTASSLASALGTLAWLGNSRDATPSILASNGGTPKQISTPGIDSIIDELSNSQDSDAYMYQEDGHNFYQINFNTDNLSLLYDFTAKKWSRLTDFKDMVQHPVLKTAYYQKTNKLLGILKATSEIVEVSLRIFTYNGNIVPRTIITENFTQLERNYTVNELDLQIEQGENETTSKVCFSVSKDRGRTYPIQQVITLGTVGQRRNLLRFRRLGTARWWTFKFDFFSEDRFVIIKATGFMQK